MNHPKPQQVRLPFDVARPKKGHAPVARICGICRTNDSKYACPRCNVAYCSLTCFQSQKHAQCSEPFYRETVLSDIASDPSQGLEEKRQMMEILRRLEEGAEGDEDIMKQLTMLDGAEEGEGEDDELAAKLADVDIDDIDTNALFHLLPQEHRDKFIAALRNPESDEAKALMEMAISEGKGENADDDDDADLEVPDRLPWWEASSVDDEEDDDQNEEQGEKEMYASAPTMISEDVLKAIKVPDGIGMKLRYNAIAISLAYLHTLLSFRLPSLQSINTETTKDLKSLLAHLVPFLVDVRSTVRYEDLRSAWSAVWDDMGTAVHATSVIQLPQDLIIRLLKMVPGLLHPPIETTIPPRILLLLSDLHTLYAKEKGGGAVSRKLAFYVVALRQLGRTDWLALKDEVTKEIIKLEGELGETQEEEEGKSGNYLP